MEPNVLKNIISGEYHRYNIISGFQYNKGAQQVKFHSRRMQIIVWAYWNLLLKGGFTGLDT